MEDVEVPELMGDGWEDVSDKMVDMSDRMEDMSDKMEDLISSDFDAEDMFDFMNQFELDPEFMKMEQDDVMDGN